MKALLFVLFKLNPVKLESFTFGVRSGMNFVEDQMSVDKAVRQTDFNFAPKSKHGNLQWKSCRRSCRRTRNSC